MSFNPKNIREWKKWIMRNRQILTECGIPEYIYKSEKRWYIFLEHEYDEVGWSSNHHSAWGIENLSRDGAEKFYHFVIKEYPDKYPTLLKSLESIFRSTFKI